MNKKLIVLAFVALGLVSAMTAGCLSRVDRPERYPEPATQTGEAVSSSVQEDDSTPSVTASLNTPEEVAATTTAVFLPAGTATVAPTAVPHLTTTPDESAIAYPLPVNTPAPTPTDPPEIQTLQAVEKTAAAYLVTPPAADLLLAGLIYTNSSGLWQVQTGGSDRLLIDQPYASLSPDGSQALYEQDFDVWIADLVTGERRNLTNTPDQFESRPKWWPVRPDVVLFERATGEGYDGYGPWYLSSIGLDGAGYRVLDGEQPLFGGYALSPTGEAIAFRSGYLYQWDDGRTIQLSAAGYGVDLHGADLTSPSWSADGSKLSWRTWPVGSSPSRMGFVIFDLLDGIGIAFHYFEPGGSDYPDPAAVWSPDGRWLAFDVKYLNDVLENGLWIFPVGGQPGDELKITGEDILGIPAVSFAWSPDGQWLLVSDGSRNGWIIASGSWLRYYREGILENDGTVIEWR